MAKTYEMHVISNTHWDREWSTDFQETRLQLVEFIDGLLDILDKEPRYRCFHMDAQTVPIEDYLEVRPECRSRIIEHVTKGRLLVGPWYTCPEEFTVNGESLVRNLYYGHRTARALGGVMKVGYSPFSYGQISQMPQIYAGFGIDTILFYHGVTHDEVSNEFIFEGADGTRALASQISSGARYNFYHHVYRRVVWPYDKDDRLYSWDEGGLPFHWATEDLCDSHHVLLDPVAHFDESRVGEYVRRLRDEERRVATTPYLAFMMGHDASVADRAELRIIDEAQKSIGKDKLFHSTLPDWIEKVKRAAGDLPVLKGERRTPKVRTGRVHLYSDVLSSRTRMKRLNAQAEWALQRWAEPSAVMAWCLGREYPASVLDLAWKFLLQSHAHDSIAGSGVDDIERDMNHRLRQVIGISRGVTARSLAHIQRTIDNSDAASGDVLLTVFNPSPYPRSEVLTAVLDVPPASASREFDLVEIEGKRRTPTQIVTRKPYHAVVNHPRNAAHMMKCERITFHLDMRDIPALGYTTLRLNPKGRFERGGIVTGHNTMENEHLHVRIRADGTLSLTHKPTGATYEDLHFFEDSGEAGQAWMHVEPGRDKIIGSRGCPVSVSLVENGPLLARYSIEYFMNIPACLDNAESNAWERLDGFDNAARRACETKPLAIKALVTLRKASRSVEVHTSFHNDSENHRLRVLFPTRLHKAASCWAASAFDVVERPIAPGPESPWHGIGRRTFPMQQFVDVSDGKSGLAIINDGLREYEVTQDADRTIAVTLLRAYELSICTSAAGWEIHPDMKLSQCPGDHEFRYLIYPHAGRWDDADVLRECERLAAPVKMVQTGRHSGTLPKRNSFLEITPSHLTMSALKLSGCGKAMILRMFNPTSRRVTGIIRLPTPIRSAELVTLEESPLRALEPKGKTLALQVPAKKIVTVRLGL